MGLAWIAPAETWVAFAYEGFEITTFSRPFNSVAEGVNAASRGDTVKIKAGSSPETLRITKRVLLEDVGGPVSLGR